MPSAPLAGAIDGNSTIAFLSSSLKVSSPSSSICNHLSWRFGVRSSLRLIAPLLSVFATLGELVELGVGDAVRGSSSVSVPMDDDGSSTPKSELFV